MTADRGGPPILRTDRLLLRPFLPTDVDDIFSYARLEEWSRYHLPHVPFPYEREDAEAFIRSVTVDASSANPNWAILLDRRVVGGASLEIRSNDVGELGYSLAPAHWNRGYGTEAARAVLDYAFYVAGLEAVEATADARNVGSWRVMEKLGMQRAALEEGGRTDRTGAQVDQVRYRVTRTAWLG